MACPDESLIAAFAVHALPVTERAGVEEHLAECTDCRRLTFALAHGDDDDAGAAPAITQTIGRFEILRSTGRGAMGEVYLARDPDLGREVVIKVGRGGEGRDDTQALARLAHPHVVTVYEAGRHGGATYVAMEHVDGVALDAWLATPRSRAAVVGAMVGAGRGLAAAHAAGVVHGDLAPRSVLVSTDGAAKVGDFGLSRGAAPAADGDVGADTRGPDRTPGYLAPEQLRGGAASEASDQFAFCVVLYEALFGHPPFTGRSVADRLASIERGPALPAALRFPVGLRRVLRRGLHPEPGRRFPSMSALVDGLAPHRPRHWLAAVAVAAVLVVAAGLGAGGRDHAPCAADPEAERAFAPERRRAIVAAQSTAPLRGPAMAASVDRMLTDYARRWRETDLTSCRRARRGGQPPPLRDHQRACLERRLRRVSDLGTVLATGAHDRAAVAIDRLPDPEGCLRVTAAAPEREPPAGLVAISMAAVDRQITRMLNLEATGQAAVAGRHIDALVAIARAVGDPPLVARALLAQGWVYAGTERYGEVEALLDEAARRAAEGHDDELAAEVWTLRAYFVAHTLGRIDEARRWLGVAEAAVVRAGEPPALRAMLSSLAGHLWSRAGEHDRAVAAQREALAILERSRPSALLSIAEAHGNLAYTLAQKRDPEARRHFEAVLARLRDAYGDHHPDVIVTLTYLGDLLVDSDPRRALEHIERARYLAEVTRGPESVHVGRALISLGVAHRNLGDTATAVGLQRRAGELLRRRLGDRHQLVGYAVGQLGDTLLAARDVAGAVAAHREAVAMLARALGPHDAPLAAARGDLARSLEAAGDAAGAMAAAEEAVSAYDRMSNGGGAGSASARVALGRLLLPDGDRARACQQLARARDLLVGTDDRGRDDMLAAQAGLVLCDVLAGGVDRGRLRALDEAVAAAARIEPATAAWAAYARARGHGGLDEPVLARALGGAARDGFARAGLARRRDEVDGWLHRLR